MNQIARTFVLVGIVVAALLALHLLPKLYLGETELRHVNILSDLITEIEEAYLNAEDIPVPEAPEPQIAISDTVFVNDSVAHEKPGL